MKQVMLDLCLFTGIECDTVSHVWIFYLCLRDQRLGSRLPGHFPIEKGCEPSNLGCPHEDASNQCSISNTHHYGKLADVLSQAFGEFNLVVDFDTVISDQRNRRFDASCLIDGRDPISPPLIEP